MDADAELLQRFAATADEAAFRGLVERYAGMVYGVALRILGEPTPAEEVSQAVFVILARKARGLGQKKLSGWLHDAAVLDARNHARKAARYRRALSAWHNEMSADSNKDPLWEEVSPHLDEALTRLPERSKSMVIMRFYARLGFRGIASAFGKSEEASRKEVDRSVQLLGTLLKKRGITTTGAALSVMLGAQALYVSPVSAAALATVSLQSLTPSGWPLLERISDWWSELGEAPKLFAVALLALTPAALNLKAINENMIAVTSDLRTLTGNPKLAKAIDSFDEALTSLDALAKKANQGIDPLLKDLEKVIQQANAGLAKIDEAAADLSKVTNPRAPVLMRLQNVLEEAERASRAIKELATELKQNPSSLLRGKDHKP